jgi:Ca2+-binding EF-hand superfamily protein
MDFYNSLMDSFDTDGNGVLDKGEWMAMLASLDVGKNVSLEHQSPEAVSAEWEQMFSVIDSGDDGVLRECRPVLSCSVVLCSISF